MDDEPTFAAVLHRLSFGEAIEHDLLSNCQAVIVGVDDETYRSYAERGEVRQPRRKEDHGSCVRA